MTLFIDLVESYTVAEHRKTLDAARCGTDVARPGHAGG